jgi:hypothetical protein
VIEVVEAYVYRPVLGPVMTLLRAAKRLHSGRLDAYLAYMLIALVALCSPSWPDRTTPAENDAQQRKAHDPWSWVAVKCPERGRTCPLGLLACE